MTQPTTTQQSFAKVDDDGGANAGTLGTTNANWTQTVDQPIRIRFLINTADKDEVDGYHLYQNFNGGGYAQVTTSSTEVQAVASGHTPTPPADGDATTERLSGPDTFVAGQWVNDGIVDSMTIAVGEETELEFCIQIVGVDVDDALDILFEVRFDNGGSLDGYTNRPTVTIDKPIGEIQQSHFRIRNRGALQTINQDSDWAAAIDTDATISAQAKDAGALFGLRFELEEVASASAPKTIIPKIQYRVNAGTWTDCSDDATIDDYIDPGSSNTNDNVIVVNKATITDGAATTNILSGSSKTFVAGTGELDTIGASVTLNDQHTEIEWRIVIKNRYSTRQQSIATDEYEFRIVESDNTILDGTYVIPKVTLALDDGYMGGVGIETQSAFNFIKIPDGTLYAPVEDGVSSQQIVMLKSIDGGVSWLQQDAAASIGTDMEAFAMDYDDTNKVIHCLHVSAAATYYQFATKDHATVPDTWIDGNTSELEASVGSVDQAAGIIVRSSNVYAFYPDLSTTDQVWYQKKTNLTDGSWGARVSVDTTGGTTDFNGMHVALGPNSDLIHIFYVDYSNFNLFHVSLNTSDVLGDIHTCETDIDQGNNARNGMTNAVSWYNGSNEKAMIGYLDETNKFLFTVVVQDDGTPDTRQNASNSVVIFADPFPGTLSRQPIATLAINTADDVAHTFYVDDSTHDLWRATHADESSWTGHTEELDATDIHAIRGQVYTKADSSVVFGYIVDEAYNQDGTTPRSGFTGSNRYAEFEITAAPVVSVPLPVTILQAINRSGTY